ncbi:amino acid adenylation domain-containing protein [Polymorphospora sp. A560]
MTDGNRSSGVSAQFIRVAREFPDRVALRFLSGDDTVTERTYAQLLAECEPVAAALAARFSPGDRALLLLPPTGPQFVAAFLGTVHAGLVAVPVPLPASGRLNRAGDRLAAIVADCDPAVALVADATGIPAGTLPDGVRALALDELPPATATDLPDRSPDDIAFLQYSSGSTGTPKAVCNTHGTVLHQVGLLTAMWGAPEPVHVAGWLPLYHDMGMLQQALLPLLTGGTTTMMSPATFAADPGRWLRAASTYRANWIAGPDFGFARCVEAIPADEAATLDLSAIRYVANGAEPIREQTVRRFAAHFAAAGLPAEAVTPAYGLAEAVLCVSSSRRPRGFRSADFDPRALAEGVAREPDGPARRTLVSSGNWFHDREVSIVDPHTGAELPARGVGEIWVGGPGLPTAYWGRPQESARTFQAVRADGRGPWLRTGDLGFLDEDGELFVCGRLRDLIIVHGANHHPNDLERTVEQRVDAVAVGGACAVQPDDGDAVLVFAEVDRHLPDAALVEIAAEIRAQIHDRHEIVVAEVALVRRMALPKTTSGKIRRTATAAADRAGRLPVLHRDALTTATDPANPGARATDGAATSSVGPAGSPATQDHPPVTANATPAADPAGTLTVAHETLGAVLGRDRVPMDTGFAELGLDSVRATRWAATLADRTGRPVPVSMLFRHPTLRRLAAALAGVPAAPAAPVPATAPPGTDAVAVVGVGVRLAGGIDSLDALGALLHAAGSTLRPPPPARADDGVPLTLPGGYLDRVDTFDAEFFGIGGAQARAMDPQQRLLLEVAWHAVEDAGLAAHRLRGTRTGVFVGQGHHDYASLPLRIGRPDLIRAMHATGSSMSATAGRIAHHLGLRGPALTVDTACSASLVAIDTALRHLADGTCDLALAGGVNLALSPETERALADAGMLSPAGRCATLSADADGYGRGEGAAVLVLKPLAAARRDGDRILAVLRGSAVAQDGASSGLTVPDPGAQADVIRAALAAAGLGAGDVDAVELHGTGTPLGDPVEISGLAEVFAGRDRPLLVGSVKTNLGHLEAAAGVAGVLRAIVALRDQVWPGSPTFTAANPRLAGTGLDYRFPAGTETVDPDRPLRRVGVSSFGFTGTIAHLVVEAAPAPGTAAPATDAGPDPAGWVPLAGADPDAVRLRAGRLAAALEGLAAADRARLLAGWRQRRDHLLPWRAVLDATDPATLPGRLANPPVPVPAPAPGPLVLRLRDGDPVGALLAGLRRWLPGWVAPTGAGPDWRQLLDVLHALGLGPDLVHADPRWYAEIGAHPDGVPPLTTEAQPGLVLAVGAASSDVDGVVTLAVGDGGRAGVAEAYRRGAPLDWTVFDPPAGADPRLPAYPFTAHRHWYPVEPAAAAPAADPAAPLTPDRIRHDVAELIDRTPDSLGADEDLVAAGLDSVRVMDLAARWRRAGADVAYADLLARPTLAAWSRRLLEARDEPAADLPAIVDEYAPFDLTPVQHAYWVGRDPAQPLGGVGCHVYAELDGHGLDPDRLERAGYALAGRHGMLRARFDADGRQRIAAEAAWPGVTVHDLRDLPAGDAGAALLAVRDRLSHRLLDVAAGEVFDLRVSLLPGGGTRLHVNLDLLVADAASIQIVLADLAALYRRPQEALPAIGTSFAAYLATSGARDRRRDEDRGYWRERLPELPAPPQLPLSATTTDGAPRFVRRTRQVSPAAWRSVVGQARRHGVTPSIALATAFAAVLGAWSTQPRFLLNLTLFDRDGRHPDVERLVADFTSLILLDVEVDPTADFAGRARTVQERFRADLAHAGYSGVEVLRDLARERGPQAASAPVVFTSNLGRDLVDGDVRDAFGELGWTVSQTPQVWLDHQVMEHAGGVLLTWDAVDDLFHDGVLDAMFGAYGRLVDWLAGADWSAVPPTLVPDDQLAVRAVVNATDHPISGKLLHDGLFHHAATRPDHLAVTGPDGTLTYQQLAQQALHIAGWLVHHHNIQPGQPVAITLPKGPHQIAAVLGTLTAGATYVPINPHHPHHRKQQIHTTAGITTTLDTTTITQALHHPNPLTKPTPIPDTTPAYIIFTSGSTGQPKGVQLTHRATQNTIEDINHRYQTTPNDNTIQISQLDFDLSVYDILGTLTAGATITTTPENQHPDPHTWAHLIHHHKVTIWNTVPTLLDILLTTAQPHQLTTLRLALTSGDWIPLDQHHRLTTKNPNTQHIALGGATEAAIWSNHHHITHIPTHWTSIPYGTPLRNQTYRITDPHGNDRPNWVPGELWIGGQGLATGYTNDPERTNTQFPTHHNQRWYRTGDQGRYWPDGTIEFLGRTDHQIKLNGHRIELGDIETHLHTHPHIHHAIATTTNQQLTAAVTVDDPVPASAGAAVTAVGEVLLAVPRPSTVAGDTGAVETALTEQGLVRLLDLLDPDAFGARTPVGPALERWRIATPMRPLVRRWLDWLADREVLAGAGDGYAAGPRLAAVRAAADTAGPENASEGAAATGGRALAGVADRLRATTGRLLAIVRGEQEAAVLLDDPVLAPEALVDAQPATAAALAALADRLAAAADRLDRPLRVAEFGGRGGRTAARLLAGLDPARVEYTLFDSSAGLLATAREHLAGLPHPVRLHRLTGTVDESALHRFDVVVANNSLHREADPAAALATVRLLLAPGGVLVALEAATLSPLALVTVAVPERGFADLDGIRRGQRDPLLSADRWRDLLADAGFALPAEAGTDQGNLWLTAARPADAPAVDLAEVRRWLAERLPAYLVPARLAALHRLPLSANGKVDRAAVRDLLADAAPDTAGPSDAPGTPAERLLAGIWSELLDAPVGRDSDFFRLGGDSLLATRMMARLQAAGVTGARLPALFAASRLADFAATLEVAAPAERPAGAPEPAAALAADDDGRHEPFEPTDVQRAYLFGRGDQFALGGVGTHYYTEFDGVDVDLVRLEEALARLVDRHDMLRVVFDADGRQRVLRDVPRLTIPVTDGAGDGGEALAGLRADMSHQVLDPARWPLFDLRAVRYGDRRTRLGLSLDNLVLDGLSMRIFYTELATLYDDPDAVLPSVGVSFRDYLLGAGPSAEQVARSQDYWRNRVVDLPPPPQLPLRTDPETVTPRFVRREAALSAADWRTVTDRAREYGLTPSAVLLTCYAEVLAAWSASTELTINLTLFDRRDVHPDINHVLGDFTSLLLLASRPRPGQGFLDRARRLQEQMWRDLEHRDVSAVWVLRELGRLDGTGRASMPVVFTSALGVADEVADHTPRRFPERVWGISQTPQVWLDHQVYEDHGGIRFSWDAVEELFHDDVLDDMFRAYRGVLARLVFADWTEPTPGLAPASHLAVRAVVNATDHPISGKLLHDGLFHHAATRPDHLAVTGPDGTLTYQQLAQQALHIAGWLVHHHNIQPGQPVAITLPKGPHQIAAVLGTLTAGATYVPINPHHPHHRKQQIHTTAGITTTLDTTTITQALHHPNPLTKPTPIPDTTPAYIIFTSGSTGQPKGVQLTHRATQNTIEDINHRYQTTPNDNTIQISQLDFDLSVYDILGTLTAGATITTTPENQHPDPHTWAHLIHHHKVTIWNTVPTLLDILLTTAQPHQLTTLRLALTSGDWIPSTNTTASPPKTPTPNTSPSAAPPKPPSGPTTTTSPTSPPTGPPSPTAPHYATRPTESPTHTETTDPTGSPANSGSADKDSPPATQTTPNAPTPNSPPTTTNAGTAPETKAATGPTAPSNSSAAPTTKSNSTATASNSATSKPTSTPTPTSTTPSPPPPTNNSPQRSYRRNPISTPTRSGPTWRGDCRPTWCRTGSSCSTPCR